MQKRLDNARWNGEAYVHDTTLYHIEKGKVKEDLKKKHEEEIIEYIEKVTGEKIPKK